MMVKTVKLSEKGQIAIPLDIREEMGLRKGDELLMLQEGGKIMMEKTSEAKKSLKGEFDSLLKLSEKTAKQLWENEYDEVWNDV